MRYGAMRAFTYMQGEHARFASVNCAGEGAATACYGLDTTDPGYGTKG